MQFIKKRQGKKYKAKKKINSPVDQILDDFDVDVLPIHARLPIM
jgi:hypothetical protein